MRPNLPSAQDLLSGTGLLSKRQALELAIKHGVSKSTFFRGLSIGFNGNRAYCGLQRGPGLKAKRIKTGLSYYLAIKPADLRDWLKKKKASSRKPTRPKTVEAVVPIEIGNENA